MKNSRQFLIMFIIFFLSYNIALTNSIYAIKNISTINSSTSSDSELKIKLLLNSGFSLSRFHTIIDGFNLHNCLGFHFTPEIQIGFDRGLYFGLESRIDYFPTKIGFEYSETLKDYQDNITFFPYSIDENADATYRSITLTPKIGAIWKKGEASYPFINFIEVIVGLGKAWYNIGRFVTGGRNNEVLDDEFMREDIKREMTDSELLHILKSEWIYSFGLKFGREITKRIRISLSLNMNVGLEYNKFYEGEWFGYTVQIWHEPHRNRMQMQHIMLEIGYQIK